MIELTPQCDMGTVISTIKYVAHIGVWFWFDFIECFTTILECDVREKLFINSYPGGGGGGTLPIWWWGVRPEKKYRGVRELLFIPKKGGVRELE